MHWLLTHPRATPEHLGLVPEFFSSRDPRPARDQLAENYAHGGGVIPMNGIGLRNWETPGRAFLTYPGDPPIPEIARSVLREETLIFFSAEILAIVQPDGTALITRVN